MTNHEMSQLAAKFRAEAEQDIASGMVRHIDPLREYEALTEKLHGVASKLATFEQPVLGSLSEVRDSVQIVTVGAA